MSDCVHEQTPSQSDAELRESSQRLSEDPVARLAAVTAPTADIEQMLAEIERGRR